MDSIKINLKETETQITLAVTLPTRDLASEPKFDFSFEDAVNYLKKQNIAYSKIVEGQKLILKNYDYQETSGLYIFDKEKVLKPISNSKPKRARRTRKKIIEPEVRVVEEQEEPQPVTKTSIRDRVKRISQKRTDLKEE